MSKARGCAGEPASPEEAPTETFQMPDGTVVRGRGRCVVQGRKILPCLPLEHTQRWSTASTVRFVLGTRYNDSDQPRDALMLARGRGRLATCAFCPFCGAAITTHFDAPASSQGGDA